MGKSDNILYKILSARSDNNVAFNDLRHLLAGLGFQERIRGDHHIYTQDGIEEILNWQPNGA